MKRHRPEDTVREKAVGLRLADAWHCTVVRDEGNDFTPFDYLFIRDGKTLAVGELKSRTHKYGAYPTVYLSGRKYKALMLCHDGGLIPLFIVQFLDRLMYIDVSTLVVTTTVLAGRNDRVNAPNDIEPIIEVPISLLMEVP